MTSSRTVQIQMAELSHSVTSPMSFRVEYKRNGTGPVMFQRHVRFQVDISAICKGDVADMLFAITFTLLSGTWMEKGKGRRIWHCTHFAHMYNPHKRMYKINRRNFRRKYSPVSTHLWAHSITGLCEALPRRRRQQCGRRHRRRRRQRWKWRRCWWFEQSARAPSIGDDSCVGEFFMRFGFEWATVLLQAAS